MRATIIITAVIQCTCHVRTATFQFYAQYGGEGFWGDLQMYLFRHLPYSKVKTLEFPGSGHVNYPFQFLFETPIYVGSC